MKKITDLLKEKKKLVIGLGVLVAFVAISAISISASPSFNRMKLNTNTTTNEITLEKAKEIALADAGLTAEQVTFIKTEVDYDDGIKIYEIDFYSESVSYDYEVRASDGVIISNDKENRKNSTTSSSNNNTSSTDISLEKAKEIALSNAGLTATQVTFIKAEVDYDDGSKNYDIEFIYQNTEYQYEVRASDGTILSIDKEYSETPSSEHQVGIANAKNTALKHANLTANQVTFIKAEVDYDDGVLVYKIEFISGQVEYEYEINASTGNIIEFDIDRND